MLYYIESERTLTANNYITGRWKDEWTEPKLHNCTKIVQFRILLYQRPIIEGRSTYTLTGSEEAIIFPRELVL